jgi:hypothetical protein
MSKSKAQGTRWETEVVGKAQAAGLDAWRLAEGGSGDPGDVAVNADADDGETWVLEHRQNLPVHEALKKAQRKVGLADLPFMVDGVAVVWKRTLPNPDGGRRIPQGVVVVLGMDDFLRLLGGSDG